jgi:hypothetical protein
MLSIAPSLNNFSIQIAYHRMATMLAFQKIAPPNMNQWN